MTLILAALAIGSCLSGCGPSETKVAQEPISAPTASVAKAETKAADKPKIQAGETKVDSTKAMPSAEGKPSPDTAEQRANDLIACEAGKGGGIPADAFDKAMAKLKADPAALEKCRKG